MPKLFVPSVIRPAVAIALCIGFMPFLSQANSFVGTGSLANPRSGHTATLLPNGKVLVAGGANSLGIGELYDPATGNWTDTGSLFRDRSNHTATLLPNGKVLIAGGAGNSPGGELYDPATGLWTITDSLSNNRINHTATLLPNGKVLVAGGYNSFTGESIASTELYDPATETWKIITAHSTARQSHSATLLPNGKVLIVGGSNNGVPLASGELYDPTTGTWTATGSLVTGRRNHTATLLPDNKVLVAGGFFYSSTLTDAEIYDPATGTWTATGSLISTRASHQATLLPIGKVLVAGGYASASALSTSAELYDPATGTWTTTGSLANARYNHTATLLSTGKVLVAGGSNGSSHVTSAELYDPGNFPDIAIEAPPGTPVSTNDTLAYGFIITGQSKDLPIAVSNIGNTGLTTIAASLSGPDAEQFSLVSTPPTKLSAGKSAEFTLRYSPTSPGEKNATLSITSNDPDEDPFTLALTGISFSNTQDIDGDGMNDAAEYLMSALGFDLQVDQTAMVDTFYMNANLYSQTQHDANYTTGRTAGQSDVTSSPNNYGLYSLSQVQALNVGVPLLEKDPGTGKFKLTMGVQRTDHLATFVPFPMNTAGTNATINTAGKLEFEFSSPDNAAFFRVESK